jgi:hypothetical protein
MSDFKQARAVQTRRRSASCPPAVSRKHGRPQRSSRTKEEQAAHEASYDKVYAQRKRDKQKEAGQALKQHFEDRTRPIAPNGPSSQFTPYQLLAYEFADKLHEHLPAEMMASAPPVTINSSCTQRFPALLTKPAGKAPFKSIADVRCPGEPAITDFVLLRTQLQSSPERLNQLRQLLSYAKQTIRIGSPYCAELKQLPPTATLLEHYRCVSLASKPRVGAPPKAKAGEADGEDGGGLAFAQNYVSGAHTAQYVSKHVAFDNRRFGVAATRTQEDVHQAMGLTTTGFPPLSQLRGHQQKRKLVHVASRRTASMWMFQIDGVTNAKVAAVVIECMPFSDEGTRESVGCCVVGAYCCIPGRASSWVDFLGLERLENKEGRSIGAGMLRVVKTREVEYIWYFWLSDSYGGIVGHRTGAIAYLRTELDRPLVFPIKCCMHVRNGHCKSPDPRSDSLSLRSHRACACVQIVSRCWKTAVNDLTEGGAAGGCRTRSPIKRQFTDAQVSCVVLLVEDVNYLYAKDKGLRAYTISLQLGNIDKTAGCIDTRFEYVYYAQRNSFGSTVIGDQVREIFQEASGRKAANGVANGVSPKRVAISKLRAVLEAGPNEIGSDADEPTAHRRRPLPRKHFPLVARCAAACALTAGAAKTESLASLSPLKRSQKGCQSLGGRLWQPWGKIFSVRNVATPVDPVPTHLP